MVTATRFIALVAKRRKTKMSKYFVHDAFNSDIDYFDTKEEAIKHAEESIGDGSDGWPQELLDGAVKIGIVTHESSKDNERHTENKEWDFECECEMQETDETFAIFAGECGVDVSGCFSEDDCKELIKTRIENLEYDLKSLIFNMDAFGGWLIEKKAPNSVLEEFRRQRN